MSKIFSAYICAILIIITLSIFKFIIIGKDGSCLSKLNFKKIIVIILAININALLSLYTGNVAKTILTCLLYTLIFNRVFEINFDKAIILSIMFITVLLIPDLIVLGTGVNVLNIDKSYFYSNVAGSIIGNVSVDTLMILITILLKRPLIKIFSYNLSYNKKMIILLVLNISLIIVCFYKFAKSYRLDEDVLVYLFTLLAFTMILFYIIKQNIDNSNLKRKYDDLLNIMKNYESDIEDQRTIVHETRNEFMTIKCKIEDNDKKNEILKYIDSIIGDKISPSTSKYSKFRYLPQNGLKGFFYYKFLEAERNGINVSVNISSRVENSFLKDIDTRDFKNLVRIIGVYLDNAIEASSISVEKKLGIEIYILNSNINIIISNTFINEIDANKLGKSRFSTKGKNRGHGLLLVDSILNSNKMFVKKTEVKENIFIQQLIIKNRNHI